MSPCHQPTQLPGCHPWRRQYKGVNYSSTCLNAHVNSCNNILVIQNKEVYTKMKQASFILDFHGVKNTRTPYIWVLTGSVLTRDIVMCLLVSTFVRKGRSVSMVNLHEPWAEVFKLKFLRFPSCIRGFSVPANSGSRERCGQSNI